MTKFTTGNFQHGAENSRTGDPHWEHVHVGESTKASVGRGAGLLVDAGFFCVAVGLLLVCSLLGANKLLGDVSITFVAIVCEAVPFMLLGTLVGGIIEEFVPEGFLNRVLESNRIVSILLAAAMGIVFPVCECAIVPVTARLIRKGLPPSIALAFLMGVPIVNPIVAASTALAYKFFWGVVLLRVGLGYLIAISTALLLQRCVGEGEWLLPPLGPAENAGCCSASPARERRAGLVSRFFAAVRHACEDFFDVGKFLFLGAFVASLARALTSIDVTSELMSSPLTSIIAMMFLAVVLNVCSEADAFIAAGFNGIVPGSAQMAFMLLGPILDLKLLFMYSTIFRKRFVLTFSAVALLMVLAGALFVEVLLGVLTNG